MPPCARGLPTALLVAIAAGCSVGQYDADYAKAVQEYRDAAPFAVLQQQPATLASGRLTITLPAGFDKVIDGPPAIEGEPPKKPDPTRVRPPFMDDFPGYQATFEQRLVDGDTELPASIAIGAVTGKPDRAAIERSILEQARGDEAFKESQQTWTDREVQPRDGGPQAWRVLSLSGQQIFESLVAGNPEFKRWDGTCELWISADPKQEVITLLAWRLPERVAAKLLVPLPELAQVVARTVAIGPSASEEPAEAEPAEPAGDAAVDPAQ